MHAMPLTFLTESDASVKTGGEYGRTAIPPNPKFVLTSLSVEILVAQHRQKMNRPALHFYEVSSVFCPIEFHRSQWTEN